MIRIAHNRVEIDDAIKGAAGPNPFVYRLARCVLSFGVIASNGCPFTRRHCGANQLESPSMCARNQLPIRISDILNARYLGWISKILAVHFCTGKTDVIEPFQEDDMRDAGHNERIAIEARQSTDAADVAISEQSIADDALIDDR